MDREMKEIEEDAKREVRVNKYKLEEECENHTNLYLRYSMFQAKAKSAVDDAVDFLEDKKSEREVYYREFPKRTTKGEPMKVTDSSVKSWVLSDKEVINRKEELRKAKEELYCLDNILRSLEHRKSQLDNLVTLWTRGYFSKPEGRKIDGRDEYQQDVRKRLNRKGEKNEEER